MERALPSGVLGPLDLAPLAREAWIRRSELICDFRMRHEAGSSYRDFRKRLRGWEIQLQNSFFGWIFGVHAWGRFILGISSEPVATAWGERRRNQDCLRLVSDASGTKMGPVS